MKRILLTILTLLLSSTITYGKELSEAELYKKAFGFVPDEPYEVKLVINNKVVKKDLKIISKQMTTNYIYGLEYVNKFLKTPISIKKEIVEKDIPFVYKLNLDKEILQLIIEDTKLKPWDITLNNHNFEPDTFTNSWYYHIPLDIYYSNNTLNYNVGFNFYFDDFYLQSTTDTIKVAYKNWAIGNLKTTMYGQLRSKDITGISYSSDYKMDFTTNNNFSNVLLENKSLIRIYKKSVLINQSVMEEGYYSFNNLTDLHLHKIIITDLVTNEVRTIKNTINRKPLFNYQAILGQEGVSAGVQYSKQFGEYFIQTELGGTYMKDYQEIGGTLRIDDTLSFNGKYLTDKGQDGLEGALRYKTDIGTFGLRYNELNQNTYNTFNKEFESVKNKNVALTYNHKNFSAEISKNIDKDILNGKLAYTKSFKNGVNLSAEVSLGSTTSYGIGISIPLKMSKRVKGTLSNYNRLNGDSYSYTQELSLNAYDLLDNQHTIKIRTSESYSSFDINSDWENKYSFFRTNYNSESKDFGVYLNTNIIGNANNVSITKQRPRLGDSVWFINKEDSLLSEVLVTNENKHYEVNQKELDFDTEFEKYEFDLEHKPNMAGEIKLVGIKNIEFNPSFKVSPFEFFTYSDTNGFQQNSFVGVKNNIYLENIKDGQYTIKFKDRTHTIIIKGDKVIEN